MLRALSSLRKASNTTRTRAFGVRPGELIDRSDLPERLQRLEFEREFRAPLGDGLPWIPNADETPSGAERIGYGRNAMASSAD
jgi:hypothetical protein